MNKKWKIEKKDGFQVIKNEGGAILGISEQSEVPIIEEDGFAFKNLSKSGKLEVYEDWRKDSIDRAKDLASKLSIEEIAGLMLYSVHQMIPAKNEGLGAIFKATYNGTSYEAGHAKPWDLTDQQKAFLADDHLRHVLVVALQDTKTAVKWNNNVQTFAENIGFGVPVNNSSDPRHGTQADAEYNGGAGGEISKWANGIGLAATFDKEIVKRFGEVAAAEYRALGITTALSPQIDIATEPRWMRFGDTFGESTKLTTDMGKAYIDGFQTSDGADEITDGWGYQSVNAMVKHFPGGGSGEGGRDAHYSYGKYAVYPGENFDEHLIPFEQGAFQLDGKTKMASAIMPYYTISYGQDHKHGENVGNSYSDYIIHDLLREKYHYEGVVCTDWGITADQGESIESFKSRCWGVEEINEVERHLKAILAGVDQFGGNNDAKPIIDAYQLGCERYGEEMMRGRMEQSARRLLLNIFRTGLFENPYLSAEESERIVGNENFAREGFESQLKSMTLLKNTSNVLPLKSKTKVYIPNRVIEPYLNFFSMETEQEVKVPVASTLVNRYFELVATPEEAEAAIVFMETPISIGYDPEDKKAGGNGYIPISLGYRPYTATTARAVSIAGGDPLEDFTDRSYHGKTSTAANESDLDNVLEMRAKMGKKPVIVVMNMKKPTIMAEFEGIVDAILVNYGVQNDAIMEVLSGAFEPSGLLPCQIPKDMETVELQAEDVPFDMECYVDSECHIYDFGYGLNWNGVINDKRVKRYK